MGDTQDFNDFRACVVLYAVTYMTESFSEYVLDISESVRAPEEKGIRENEYSESKSDVLNIPNDKEGENNENKSNNESSKTLQNEPKSHEENEIRNRNGNGNGNENENGNGDGIPHTPPRNEIRQSSDTMKKAESDENGIELIGENRECVSILLFSCLPLFSFSCLALALVDNCERYSHLTRQLSAVFTGKFGEFLSLFPVEKSLFSMERTERKVYNVNKCRGMVDAVCGEQKIES